MGLADAREVLAAIAAVIVVLAVFGFRVYASLRDHDEFWEDRERWFGKRDD